MLFLGGRTSALQDFKLDEVERHEAKGEAGHNTSEQNEETGEASVNEPPCSGKRNIIGFHHRDLVMIMVVVEEEGGGGGGQCQGIKEQHCRKKGRQTERERGGMSNEKAKKARLTGRF